MKKNILIIFFLLLLLNEISAGIIINEVELNPVGDDSGCEWVELFSDEEVNLEDWKLVNNDGDEFLLDDNCDGYFIIKFDKQWLDNNEEKIFLYYLNELIDETDLFVDSDNDDKTWQFCEGGWVFLDSSEGEENDCIEIDEVVDEVSEELESYEEGTSDEGEKDYEENKAEMVEDIKENILEKKNIIKLGEGEGETQDIKSNEILYESKTEYIKKYAIYGFALLCVFLCILLILNKLD